MPGAAVSRARNVERIVAGGGSAAKSISPRFEATPSAMLFRRAAMSFMGGELRPPEYDRLATSQASIRSVDRRRAAGLKSRKPRFWSVAKRRLPSRLKGIKVSRQGRQTPAFRGF